MSLGWGYTESSLPTHRHSRFWLALVVVPVISLGCACNPRASDPPADSAPDPLLEGSTLELPMVNTTPEELNVEGFRHVEVFRIRRDFGKRDFEIAMDAWMPNENLARIETVRLWWLKTRKGDERGPFGTKTKRHFDISYTRAGEGTWNVLLEADEHKFVFVVAADGKGDVTASGTVVLEGGDRIENCQMHSADLRASKVLGLPTGIKELQVTCTDGEGRQHTGKLAS